MNILQLPFSDKSGTLLIIAHAWPTFNQHLHDESRYVEILRELRKISTSEKEKKIKA